LGAAGVAADAPADDHLHAVLDLELEAAEGAAPADGIDGRALVLEAEIEMAGAVIVGLRHLAAHAHPLEAGLEGALHRLADFADGELRQVAGDDDGLGHGCGHYMSGRAAVQPGAMMKR